MSGAREITTKIRSVENTRKVTSALEMVSAAKIKKSQNRMAATRPYAHMIKQVIGHLSYARPEYKHPFTVEHEEITKVGYVVITSDRGLCGGLNNNLFRLMLADIAEWQAQGVEVDVVAFGKKAKQFFKRLKVNLVASAEGLGETPQIADLVGPMKILLDGYKEGSVGRVVLCYNDFINTMAQKPVLDQLLPLPKGDEDQVPELWDYIYEPEAEQLLDTVLTRYIESLVYQGVLENLASEHAARMVAMKSASDNANELIDNLKLVYNKARQAAITQEISEIVGGAAAV
jgi:F-type H+-transporting ATPase subunit gamma